MMNNPQQRIPEKVAPELLELASRYYTEQTQGYDVKKREQEKQAAEKQSAKFRQKLLMIGASMVAVCAVWTGWTYNSIQSSNSKVDAAGAQVENQLQRRADLIPNLVNITQAYGTQEQELVALLERSRQAYLQAETPEQKADAIAQINQAIESFTKYAAVNPQLQSSQLFTNLQYEITGTENRLAVERMRYNQAVQAHNQKIQSFPNSLVANIFGFCHLN